MKSLKDAINLYRTLAAEALAEFSYSERGEAAGRHLDDKAFALSRKIRPARPPRPDFGGFEHLEDLGTYQETLDHYIKDLAAATAVPPQFISHWADRMTEAPDVTGLFKQADQRPLSQEWADRVAERMAVREEYAFPQVTLPSFTDGGQPTFQIFDEIQPWQEQMVDSINAVVEKNRLAMEGYVFGTVHHPEWIYLDKAALLAECKHLGLGDSQADHILGVPLHQDPDNENLVRLWAADLQERPNGVKIAEALLRFKATVTPPE